MRVGSLFQKEVMDFLIAKGGNEISKSERRLITIEAKAESYFTLERNLSKKEMRRKYEYKISRTMLYFGYGSADDRCSVADGRKGHRL